MMFPIIAFADDYPNRPITFIVPYPAGGPTDTTARIVGEKLSEILDQPVLIENRGGAGAVIGTTALSEAAPDGYTIGLLTPASTTAPLFQANVPWAATDFVPVHNMADVPLVFAVHPSVEATSMAELISLAKERPGELNYSVAGFGVITHLAFEWLKLREGFDATFVAYSGAADSLRDVAAGEVQITYEGIAGVLPMAREGLLRPLAVSSAERHPDLPDVPTMAEAGIEDFEIISWFGVFAPPGTPDDIAGKLENAVAEAMADVNVRQRISATGQLPSMSDSEWLGQAVVHYSNTWATVVEQTGIEPQ